MEVSAELGIAQLVVVPLGELAEVGGQLVGVGERGAVDEHGRDGDIVAPERSSDFQPDEVVGLVEPATAVGVGDGQPVRPEDRDQEVRSAQSVVDGSGERVAGPQSLDVPEHMAAAQPPRQGVVDPTGGPGGVVTAVADEDVDHRPWGAAAGDAAGGPRSARG